MRIWLISILVCCLPLTGWAQEQPSIDCNALEASTIDEGNVFKDVHDRAKQTAKAVCLGIQDIFEGGAPLAGKTPEEKLQKNLVEFGAYATKAIVAGVPKDAFRISADEMKFQQNYATFLAGFAEMQEQLTHTRLGSNSKWPDFTVAHPELVPRIFDGFFSTNVTTEHFKFLDDDPSCRQAAGKSCVDIFKDFEAAFKTYRKAYVDFTNATNQELLANLNSDWDRFLEVSKSQTAIEVWLTTLWHAGHFQQDHLVGPPTSEVIALHPQVVYEYMDEVSDDNNAEFGMAVEWLGMNWWDLKVPIGVSVASVFTDRVGANDFGTGVMLHLDNKYALGWSRHGDEDGFYFTLDLLKLIGDKKQQYERYIH